MVTALTVNGSAVAATTLAAAGKLFNATGGSSGNTSTKVGSGTQFKQIFAKGTTTNQTGVSSIPLPTDSNFNGWMWDVTTLEGQTMAAGTWTPTIHLLASTSTTITPTVQWFKRSSGGAYTSIGSVAGSSIALTTSSQALTFTPPSLAVMAFATGDKLVMWLWVNQTAGGATNSTISVVEATSGSSAGVVSEAQAVTPGYGVPTTATKSSGVRTPVRTQGGQWTNVLAQDTFSGRTVSGSFGTASDGESYIVASSTAATISVGSGKGTVFYDNSGGGFGDYFVVLGTQTFTEAEALLRFSVGTITGVPQVKIFLRYNTSTGNGYRARINCNGASSTLIWEYLAAFAPTTISTTTITVNATTSYWFRFRMMENVGAIKVWADGTSEPAAWTASGTDATINTPGGVGIELAMTGTTAGTGVNIDSFSVSSPISGYASSLRLSVRTQVTKSLSLRALIRTQKTINTTLRMLVRTQKTVSATIRTRARTQKTVSAALRVPARTLKTGSTSLRAVIRGITKVAPLRVPVRTLVSKSSPLRTRVRTLVSDVAVLRVVARTTHSVSSPLRSVVASLASKTAPLRVQVRTARSLLVSLLAVIATKMTPSAPVRVILRGRTLLTGMRARVRTLSSRTATLRVVTSAGINLVTGSVPFRVLARTAHNLSSPVRLLARTGGHALVGMRARVASQRTLSSVMRIVAGTKHSLSTSLRIPLRSLSSRMLALRTRVASLASKTAGLRARVASRGTTSVPMRIVARGISRLVGIRAKVMTQVNRTAPLRLLARTARTGRTPLRVAVHSLTARVQALRVRVMVAETVLLALRVRAVNAGLGLQVLRTCIRTKATPTATIRIVCIQPNAVVLLRSGQATTLLRSGQASVTVRSGHAATTVRSGQAAILIEEED